MRLFVYYIICFQIPEAQFKGQGYSMCCEIPWRPKLPGTLLYVSLLLTVIGGYSDSNGIPAFASNSPPSFCPYVHMSLFLYPFFAF